MNERQGDLFRAETTWFHVFHSMIETGDIARMGPYAVTVYLVIKAHTNFDTGRSFPAIDTITDESGISRSQVIRSLKVLEANGYIARSREGRRNEYRLREKICIQDEAGHPTAVATWDYRPSSVKAATADLKNVLVSGNFSGSKIVQIERLQVNVTHASGNAVVFNAQEIACLPQDMRDMLLSLRTKLEERRQGEVIHTSV
ncbi:helix-turn-helix domain-containing protein [Burkholderia gladioli pv. alliicola]|uniref:helix-turn-helix domain-containing protein n=1 Tax=Burkholderia gladioli TaxID=28095 RepID=UPI001904494F|nr:helix-turn-helix domain-containing protein [Burkholderia gladioli]MBJ9714629.1 helix-turn-helix domain-containing protein [Burkholderia gladioli]MDZ4038918.1 helix-turn-helix domain-containing protein [Burkholderia gladioli pv. alliicola]